MAVSNIGTGGGGFQVSAGINVSEIDLTTIVPVASTTIGGLAGVFNWGPVDKVILVDSQNTLVKKFGKPTNNNAETWFTAANFLDYGNKLLVTRAANTANVLSAIANSSAVLSVAGQTVKNEDHYTTITFDANCHYVAKYPGALGNSLKVSVCGTANQYKSNLVLRTALSNTSFNDANTKIDIAVGSNTATVNLANSVALTGNTPLAQATAIAATFTTGDIVEFGNSAIGKQYLKISSVGSVAVANLAGTNTGSASFTLSFTDILKLSANQSSNTVTRYWEYFNQVDVAPGQSTFVATNGNTAANDEMHVVIADADGKFTGNPGTVLEVFKGLSRATDAKNLDGSTNYYKDVIRDQSQYMWPATDRAGASSNTALNIASSTNSTPLTLDFAGGADGAAEDAVAFSELAFAWDKFRDADSVDVSLLLTGKARGGTNGEQLLNYVIDNICEVRKDCVVFGSPDKSDVVNNLTDIEADVVGFFDSVRSSSYAVFDSGYKYQYDKYNDLYRWIPLNGDIAGLCVNTDNVRDPWFSPAGHNRGNIKNVVRLAWNPTKAQRDMLYKNRINPVVTFNGEGTLLYGDKTGLARPSAFDRINVRRLFIVLEKSIARAAKSTLFEFNDEFTRAQFKNIVEPFLRDVQGRRGIYDFRVVCDETNNTPEVIDSNRFIGDIYIKPAKSINFIQLNFVAVRTGAEFQEIVGQF
jgi:hypothetical protein